MADSSHTITDYGQTLRGRNMLVLVDGVPLNTNRDSSRNLANINPADIEQIEVLRGSSAIYGSGAAGGIISVRTKRPSGETKAETIVTGSAPLSNSEAPGLELKSSTIFLAAAMWSTIPSAWAPSMSEAHSMPRGAALHPSPARLVRLRYLQRVRQDRLQAGRKSTASVLREPYNASQDTDYASDPSVARLPAGSTAARPIKGLVLADQNQIKNTMLGLDYENRDLAGSAVAAQLYYRDFYTRFAPFDARAVPVRGANVDQSMQNSDVFGGRLTIKTPLGQEKNTLLIWGRTSITSAPTCRSISLIPRPMTPVEVWCSTRLAA
jgi:iron complex outermembrane receptor protein